ncbi:hypothetical protein [Pseudomonas sp. AMR01]|uniref:hypothetical protein n=1 Tax=Pseudomonas sp. AMR01 TaxID=3064904 RepID=UPI0035BED184
MTRMLASSRRDMPHWTEGSIAMDVVPYLLLAAMVVVIFYARKRARQKLDAEFRAALAMLNIDQYEFLVDKVKTPGKKPSAAQGSVLA